MAQGKLDCITEHVTLAKESETPTLLYTFVNILKPEVAEIAALLDSGASANFIHPRIVEQLHIPLITLDTPRNVRMLLCMHQITLVPGHIHLSITFQVVLG